MSSGTPTPPAPAPKPVVVDPDKLTCKVCGYMAADFADLRNHNNNTHLATIPSPTPAPPPASGKESLSTEPEFDPEKLTCKVCGYMAADPKELREHNNEKHVISVSTPATPAPNPAPQVVVVKERKKKLWEY